MVEAPGKAVPKSGTAEHEVATLIAREERTRLALAAGRIYTWDWDIATNRLVWSEGLEKELLIARAPYEISAFRALVHPDDLDFVGERIEAALRRPEDYEAEFRMIRGDGSVRWCSARAIVVRDCAGKALRMVGVDQDVTERRELLHRTLESEARLRLAMEAAGAGAWEYAIDKDEFIASDRALELHGLPPGAPISNREAIEAVHAEDRECVEQAMLSTVSTGKPFRQEMRAARADGSVRWLLSQAVLRTEGGRRRLIGQVEDITDRRNTEAALLQTRERFAVALGNSPTAVFEQDLDLRYTWIYNPKLGYAAADIIGKTDADLMDASFAAPIQAVKRQVIATGKPARQEVAAAFPGSEREYYDLHVEARRDPSGRIVGVMCAAAEITARKKVEDALRDSEARYRSAMAIGRMASWETNYLTGVRKWTPEGLSLFGLDLPDGVGTIGGETDEFLRALHPGDRALHEVYRDVEMQRDSFAAEYRIVLPDGRTRWMSGYAQVVDRGADGRPLRMVNVATDITERKAMEDRSQYLLRELSHRSKNTLAVIQAIVNMSSRTAGGAKEFSRTITDRLSALAAANDLLTSNDWKGARLGELVERQIGAFVELPNPRVIVSGPDVALTVDAMQSIGLALHELTTNAVKYGALSAPYGEVRVFWRLEPDLAEPILRVEWTEQGGPPVAPPQRKGFGQVVIKQMVEQALSATATIEYPPAGLRWSLRAPAARVLGPGADRLERCGSSGAV